MRHRCCSASESASQAGASSSREKSVLRAHTLVVFSIDYATRLIQAACVMTSHNVSELPHSIRSDVDILQGRENKSKFVSHRCNFVPKGRKKVNLQLRFAHALVQHADSAFVIMWTYTSRVARVYEQHKAQSNFLTWKLRSISMEPALTKRG